MPAALIWMTLQLFTGGLDLFIRVAVPRWTPPVLRSRSANGRGCRPVPWHRRAISSSASAGSRRRPPVGQGGLDRTLQTDQHRSGGIVRSASQPGSATPQRLITDPDQPQPPWNIVLILMHPGSTGPSPLPQLRQTKGKHRKKISAGHRQKSSVAGPKKMLGHNDPSTSTPEDSVSLQHQAAALLDKG